MTKNDILKLVSKYWPWPIYIGTSLTVDDRIKRMQQEFKVKFNRRIHRTVAKVQMKPEYAVYEISNINIDSKSSTVIYTLEHCATGSIITVTEDIFKTLFSSL